MVGEHTLSSVFLLVAFFLFTLSVACAPSCPTGNVVVPARDVSFALQLQTADGPLTSHGSSPPDGEGISFDRATIVVADPQGSPLASGDLGLYSLSPGCHPDSAGNAVCDRDIRIRLTIHGVMTGVTSVDLDDQRAQLQMSVAPTGSPATGPCPGKPGLTGCAADGGQAGTGTYVSTSGLTGHLDVTQLAEDCTGVLSSCALAAQGTFELSAMGPSGEPVKLSSGTLTAADTLMARTSCDN